jgi:hypothetical protein
MSPLVVMIHYTRQGVKSAHVQRWNSLYPGQAIGAEGIDLCLPPGGERTRNTLPQLYTASKSTRQRQCLERQGRNTAVQ